jgi:hypothetical protein
VSFSLPHWYESKLEKDGSESCATLSVDSCCGQPVGISQCNTHHDEHFLPLLPLEAFLAIWAALDSCSMGVLGFLRAYTMSLPKFCKALPIVPLCLVNGYPLQICMFEYLQTRKKAETFHHEVPFRVPQAFGFHKKTVNQHYPKVIKDLGCCKTLESCQH